MGIAMKLFYELLVALHVVGVVAIAYGFFKELHAGTRGINPAMLHGASTQVLTGILMVGLRESGKIIEDEDLNMTKIGIKLLVAIAILAACSIGKRAADAKKYWAIVGALTAVNIVVAVAL